MLTSIPARRRNPERRSEWGPMNDGEKRPSLSDGVTRSFDAEREDTGEAILHGDRFSCSGRDR